VFNAKQTFTQRGIFPIRVDTKMPIAHTF